MGILPKGIMKLKCAVQTQLKLSYSAGCGARFHFLLHRSFLCLPNHTFSLHMPAQQRTKPSSCINPLIQPAKRQGTYAPHVPIERTLNSIYTDKELIEQNSYICRKPPGCILFPPILNRKQIPCVILSYTPFSLTAYALALYKSNSTATN